MNPYGMSPLTVLSLSGEVIGVNEVAQMSAQFIVRS
jgi:hypothetical protein